MAGWETVLSLAMSNGSLLRKSDPESLESALTLRLLLILSETLLLLLLSSVDSLYSGMIPSVLSEVDPEAAKS